MKISEAVEFLEWAKKTWGEDLELQSLTGFWIKQDHRTGKHYVVEAVGDGKSVAEVLLENKVLERKLSMVRGERDVAKSGLQFLSERLGKEGLDAQ